MSPYFCGVLAGFGVGFLVVSLRVGFHREHPRLTIAIVVLLILDVVMDGLLGRFFA